MTEAQLETANKLKRRIEKLDLFINASDIKYINEKEGKESPSLWESMLYWLPFNFHTKYSETFDYPYELETDYELVENIRKVVKEAKEKYQHQLNCL